MEATIAFSISNELVSFFIILPTIVNILLLILVEIVVIHKVVARVVRWVDVNHLHFAQIVLTKEFQHLKIVTLNIQVLGIVEINALLTTWAKSICGRRISQTNRIALIRPSELVTFFWTFHNIL